MVIKAPTWGGLYKKVDKYLKEAERTEDDYYIVYRNTGEVKEALLSSKSQKFY